MGILDKVFDNAKKELQLNAEYYKQQQEERKLLKHYLTPKRPDGPTSAKVKADLLLMDARHLATEINYSDKLEDFETTFVKLADTLQQLMWLNEKANIPAFGLTPRENLEQILSNMEATINDFIERAKRRIFCFGRNKAEEYESLARGLEDSGHISSFLTSANRESISQIYAEAENLKKEQQKAELLRKQKVEEIAVQRKKKEMLNEVGKSPVDLSDFNAMDIIIAMETRIDSLYKSFLDNACSPSQGEELFSVFRNACQSSKLPLAAEVRLESLLAEYEPKFFAETPLYAIDHMDGYAFERWCAALLRKNGFTNIEVTQGSNDQGVDIIATKDGVRYAIQCKCYSSDLGNTPVQEVHTGKSIYHCHVGVVMTNRYFTTGAEEAAKATGTFLWDRNKLKEMLEHEE